MTIQTGEQIPAIDLTVMGEQGPEKFNLLQRCQGKKVVLFAVPGAFTPGCSKTHLPGFVRLAEEIKAKGVDEIICTSVNDVFVMAAWGEAHQANAITMAADGNGELAAALGLSLDASGNGMGTRSKRYAMIIDNANVGYIGVDQKGIDVSSAETVLAQL
ncbi:peroxiredoxin [Dasania sp. GY-MA-18]|uniref:Glutathione-dependent peroxiredoxin n=1 Tax=Dasania phycosphaerae TaxID=2950436 RepID=A0A9J6RKB3_9GAMM|nr:MULTISPECIES: peroxiredoxin [Dasania]MCR8922236.1 peroxiredoxin [Dasania sp. GY-MA-18]MCZ0864664.1 peroxiredoxin [Dasania phycosphaerae]MCZ0868392.1 peroxiredoxin [Dasania phycosphaerae]